MDEYQELNAREEQDIEIMMEGCECAISNAEAFAEKLSRELQVLDGVRFPHAGREWCTWVAKAGGAVSSASPLQLSQGECCCVCKLSASCHQALLFLFKR